MSRFALLALLLTAASCSKSAANQEPSTAGTAGGGGTEKVMVPGGAGATTGAPKSGTTIGGGGAEASKGGGEDPFKLKPEEGTLAVQGPSAAKAGAETTATITVTPGKGFHVNTEFPIKLTLDQPSGVTLAKALFVAGGHDKSKGDAEALDESQLVLAVKLTPAASGKYTVNGSFKFAVCDKDSCLAKKEQIAIQIAAN